MMICMQDGVLEPTKKLYAHRKMHLKQSNVMVNTCNIFYFKRKVRFEYLQQLENIVYKEERECKNKILSHAK
jgi:hypothetical protein